MRGVQPNFKTPLWRVPGMWLARSIGLEFDRLNQDFMGRWIATGALAE